MMRLYFYISRSGSLRDLSNILHEARRLNAINGISGVMTYDKGFYLQIFEGGDKEVHNLIDNIKSDKRHSHIETILNISTNQRYFEGWPMSLVPSLSECREFQAFMIERDSQLKELSAYKLALVDRIYRGYRYKNPAKKESSIRLESCSFSIMKWPNFNQLSLTPGSIKLCCGLFDNEMTYSELLKEHYFSTERELKKTLIQLMDYQCLRYSKVLSRTHGASRQSRASEAFMVNTDSRTKVKAFTSGQLH